MSMAPKKSKAGENMRTKKARLLWTNTFSGKSCSSDEFEFDALRSVMAEMRSQPDLFKDILLLEVR